MLKIDEYRRQVRKAKAQNKSAKHLVEDVFWKGISYFDLCKVERELKEVSDKVKIKAEIQQRKEKL